MRQLAAEAPQTEPFESDPREIPQSVVEVTETEVRADLGTFLDRVAHTDAELVVTRADRPIAAVISMDGYWALRKIVEEIQYQLYAEVMEEV